MSVERILLKGGCVLTLDPDIGNYPKGDVLIEDNKIAAVGPLLRVSRRRGDRRHRTRS